MIGTSRLDLAEGLNISARNFFDGLQRLRAAVEARSLEQVNGTVLSHRIQKLPFEKTEATRTMYHEERRFLFLPSANDYISRHPPPAGKHARRHSPRPPDPPPY